MMLGCLVMRSSETSATADREPASARAAATMQQKTAFSLVIFIGMSLVGFQSRGTAWIAGSLLVPALPPCAITLQRVCVRRIRSRQRPAAGNLAEHELLEYLLLVRVAGDLVGQVPRNHDHA